jgi:integrase
VEHFFVSERKVARYFEPPAGTDLDGLAVVRRAGALKDGTPFFLGADMRPIEPLCTFFFELAKVLKPKTLADYAYDLMDLVGFLEQLDEPADLLSAAEEDLVAYRRERTQLQDAPIAPATWRRRRAAINSFYDWAVDSGALARRPYFKRKSGRDALSGGPVPQLDVRPLSYRQWRFFKQVGLLGQLPDGRVDASFRGRDRLRNAAAAELAITTGMRLREFSCVLDVEVGAPRSDGSAAEVHLEATAKYGLARVVRVLHPTLRQIDLYRRTERAAAVRRAAPTLARRRAELFVVGDIDERRMRVTGRMDGRVRTFRIRDMDAALRRRAVTEGAYGLEPMGLFVGRGGRMLGRSRWEQVFDAAHVRALRVAAAHDPGFAMPQRLRIHDLRHTFAVYMLQQLTQLQLEQARAGAGGHEAYLTEHIAKNPLITLQGLLGHRLASSTVHYLRYIQDTSRIVEAAVAAWNEAERTYADYADALAGRAA